jgi:hypothetical protein
MPRLQYWAIALVALAGCSPNIGDKCVLHTDCSQTGTRICDPTFPGGYCTIFSCEPGSCPSESVCVGYGSDLASERGCTSPLNQRLERTFCMYACDSDSDCRSGYVCKDFGTQPNDYNAIIVEGGSPPPRTKVCTVPLDQPPAPPDAGPYPVCNPPPFDASPAASFPPGSDASRSSPDASRDGGEGGMSLLDARAGDAAPDARAHRDGSP